MKKFILAATFLTSILSFNSQATSNDDVNNLAFQMTGFEILSENNLELNLKHYSGLNLILSKASFESEKDASSFCEDRHTKLDSDFNVLLLAMSGAATQNKIIHDLITFDVEVEAGIVSWSGQGNNKVQMMYNGRGTYVDEVSINELNAAIKHIKKDESATFKVPAVCVTK